MSTTRLFFAFLVAALVVATALPLPLAAQSAVFARSASPASDEESDDLPDPHTALASDTVFEDALSVLEVEVPVQVLVGGKPVTGLEAADFEIVDGGEVREIVGFEVVDLSRASVGSGDESGEAGSSAAEPPPPGSRRQFLALFDIALSRRPFLSQAVDSVRVMVAEQLHPSDRVGVAVLGRNGAQLMLGMTDDRERIGLALDLVSAQIAADPAAAQEAVAALSEDNEKTLLELTEAVGPAAALALGDPTDRSITALPSVETDFSLLDSAAADAPAIAEALDFLEIGNTLAKSAVLSQVRRLNQSLADLATLLRDIDGQKYFLYFSDGLQDFENLNLSGSSIRDSPWGTGAGVSKAFAELVDAFRRAGWTIHGFAIGGLSSLGNGALFYLADETGGKLYENYNRLHVATERMVELTSVTYNLVFQVVDLPRDGRYHPIEVRLVDPPRKARVQAREGYYAPKPAKQWTELERELADGDALFSGPDRFEIPGELLVLPSPTESGQWRVSLVAGLDVAELVAGERLQRRLVFDAQAWVGRPAGRGPVVSGILSEKLRFDLRRDGEALRSGGLTYLADFEVGPGVWEVRARLRDRESGRQFVSTRRLALEDPAAPTIALPLLLQARGERVVARSSDSAADQHSPFAVGEGVFLPQVPPRYPTGSNVPILLQSWGGALDGAALQVRVLDASGRVPPGDRLRGLERVPVGATGENRTVVFAQIETDGLAPGAYQLEMRWTRGDDTVWNSLTSFDLTP